jgi:hypothetical protein
MKWLSLGLFPLLLLSSCVRQGESGPRPELAGVYRSARAIEGALVREFSKELLLARDSARYNLAPKLISSTLDKYAEVLAMYKDSEQVWSLEVRERKYDDALPVLAAKYGVPQAVYESKNSYAGTTKEVNFEMIRQAIWEQTSKLQEQQIAIVYGFTPKN